MPSSQAELLDTLEEKYQVRPWGCMYSLSSQPGDLTVKYIELLEGQRTSLQRHDRKDELLLILGGTGWVEADETRCSAWMGRVRIPPGTVHRVTGPLTYLEVSSYDGDDDTVRLEDDYGRDG